MNVEEIARSISNLSEGFKELSKTAPELREAMDHLRSVPGIDPQHLDTVRKHLFTDYLTGGIMGNQAAFEDFKESPQAQTGYHIFMDGNDFGSINKMHSHSVGNQAIKQMAGALREAADEAVGRTGGSLHRIGGDEFHFHAPSHEHAAHFIRLARNKLDRIAPVGGTHNLRMSFGLGMNVDDADQALGHAKTAKKQANYPLGQSQHHVHSLIPGHEGPIPLDESPTRVPLAVR